MSTIDLSRLSPPDVVEALDFETILAEMVTDLQSRDATFDALIESDPAYKILEVAAYRELLIRQRVNDAARGVMLASAGGNDLDHLGALCGTERLLLDPGDPAAVPPIPPTYEDDERFRSRIQLAPEAITTAGSQGSYEFHALSADGDVNDVDIASPAAGQVVVTVLSETGDGAPAPALLDTVTATLSDTKVRPLTDQVTVQGPTILTYVVTAALYVYDGPDPEVTRQEAETAVTQYTLSHHRLGHDITESGLHAALHREGVQRVELTSPLTLPIAVGPQQAAYCTGVTVTIGGIDE